MAELHRSLDVGASVDLVMTANGGDREGVDARRPGDVVVGAGFDVVSLSPGAGRLVSLGARRARTLPDTVGPDMRLLVCGLNPSIYAADAGVAFARPGNRFWPAARAAGLVSADRDPFHALRVHGVGLTDLVKRATVGAGELTTAEYRHGLARVERLCAWLRPAVVCFVGLAGWRAVVNRTAHAGLQPDALGDVPVYLMPSTSGRNAHTSLDELTYHLCAAER